MTLAFYALLLRGLWSYLNATNVAPLLSQRKPASHALSPGIVTAAVAEVTPNWTARRCLASHKRDGVQAQENYGAARARVRGELS